MSSQLSYIAQRTKNELSLLQNGAKICNDTGRSIQELVIQSAAGRFALAQLHVQVAKSLARQRPPRFRSSVSRAYYGMYHAARAVVFLSSGGDDNQEHQKLPKAFPADFPDRDTWENVLKDARLERNRADYDPYPEEERDFRDSCRNILTNCESFLVEVEKYLRKMGCPI